MVSKNSTQPITQLMPTSLSDVIAGESKCVGKFLGEIVKKAFTELKKGGTSLTEKVIKKFIENNFI